MPEPTAPKVFISYSHDSPQHSDRVCALANRLRSDGIDCHIDQFETSPEEGWPLWMDRQIAAADFVLVVCTPTYLRRFTGQEQAGVGHGVRWESLLTANHIYAAGARNTKCIPVLFNDGKAEDIPLPLHGATRYWIDTDEGYDRLYRHLTNQPNVRKSELGPLRKLPSREPNPGFFTNPEPDHGATTPESAATLLATPPPLPAEASAQPTTQPTAAKEALSRSDLATLADLLVRSGRADADRRVALCLEIGVDRHRLPFLQAATSDFATQLVHHLKDIDDRDGLRALCQVLSQTLRGEPAERLAVLRQKLG